MRLSTGMKMFLLLSLALLPLGIIALLASFQANRSTDPERQALMTVNTNRAAQAIYSAIAADRSALQVAANVLSKDPGDARICDRIGAIMHNESERTVPFAIFNRKGQALCRTRDMPVALVPENLRFAREQADLLPKSEQMLVRTPSDDGALAAVAVYKGDELGALASHVIDRAPFTLILEKGQTRMGIADRLASGFRGQLRYDLAPVGLTSVSLRMGVPIERLTAAELLTSFLPLLMWLAAAVIGWIVVDRLLISPLVQLRTMAAAYRPGEVLEPLRKIHTPSIEIRELGATFREITQTVADHEGELAAGLARQTRLTREVHHRVKNNLQIIASLINLHSRSAASREAADAYASIQRRVDALAVVHRNHYAEMEENRGIGLRSLISELAANLRGTAPEEARRMGISIDCDNLQVSQDIAVPVAFILTELVELSMLIDPATQVRISAKQGETPSRALIAVRTHELRPSPAGEQLLEKRFGRVLTGLSRQLRAPLHYDADVGEYQIEVDVIA